MRETRCQEVIEDVVKYLKSNGITDVGGFVYPEGNFEQALRDYLNIALEQGVDLGINYFAWQDNFNSRWSGFNGEEVIPLFTQKDMETSMETVLNLVSEKISDIKDPEALREAFASLTISIKVENPWRIVDASKADGEIEEAEIEEDYSSSPSAEVD